MRLRLRGANACVVVGALSLTVTASYGVLMYAFPVVLPAMQAELGRAQPLLTGAWSVAALVGGVAAIPVGRWIDRHGAGLVMMSCAVAASALVAAWSRVESAAALYLVWAGLGACSAGLFYEPAFATIAQRFRRDRAQAIAVVSLAGGLASTIFVPLTAALTERLGWRDAVLCLAFVLAACTVLPAALLPRRTRKLGTSCDAGPHATRAGTHPSHAAHASRDAVRSASFRWLTAAFALSTLAATAFVLHLVPMLVADGLDLRTAGSALAATGVAKLLGRAAFAPLVRRAGIARIGVLVHAVQALGVLALVTTSSPAGLAACVLLFGAGEGAGTAARAELVAELYGPARYGAVAGVLALFLAVARALGPVAASLVLMTAGYDALLAALVATLVLAGAAVRAAARSRVPGPGCVLSARQPSIMQEDVPHFDTGAL